MIHLLAFAMCLVGFAALALAMRRQQRDVIGRSLRRSTTHGLRAIGGGVLFGVLVILVAWQGGGLGLVMFSGHTSIAAGLVYGVLVSHAGKHARLRKLPTP